MAQVVIAMSNILLSEGIDTLIGSEKELSVSRILTPGKEYSNEDPSLWVLPSS
ncbi:MAG: hypothetical protein HS130_02085 [Deltaproteobacteria bacterium]|nr:hypothetical protein [Deltaproteobacteria bacterium]